MLLLKALAAGEFYSSLNNESTKRNWIGPWFDHNSSQSMPFYIKVLTPKQSIIQSPLKDYY